MGNTRAARTQLRISHGTSSSSSGSSRRARWAGPWLCVGLIAQLATAAAAAAEGGHYRYTDERGVVHFSDAPFDARFQTASLHPPGVPTIPAAYDLAPRFDGYDDVIARASRFYRVQPALVKAVVAAESNFKADAVSHKGAQGLMQLMPFTAERMGVEDPFIPEQNVHGGTRYLRMMLERYRDLKLALAAYNAGPKAVDRYQGIPPYPETEAYVQRVLNYYRGYHGDFRR